MQLNDGATSVRFLNQQYNVQLTTMETYLHAVNEGQGPGVTVMGEVFSTSKLKKMVVTFSKYGAIGLPILITFQAKLNDDAS